MSSDSGLGQSALDALLGGLAGEAVNTLKRKTANTKLARKAREKLGSDNIHATFKDIFATAVSLAEEQAPLKREVKRTFLSDAHNRQLLINWIIERDQRDPTQFKLVAKDRREKSALQKFVAHLPEALDKAWRQHISPDALHLESLIEQVLAEIRTPRAPASLRLSVAARPKLKVMVSHTLRAMPLHHRTVIDAIYRAGLEPINAKAPDAKGAEAIRQARQYVDQAEVYVGVFGFQYGYTPRSRDDNPEKKSIAELEYRHAAQRGLPMVLFFMSEDHPITKKEIDSGIHEKRLNVLKNELQQQHTVETFDSEDELRALVGQALEALKAEQPPVILADGQDDGQDKDATVLPEPPNLYAVPSYILTNTFVGRKKELQALREWAQSRDTVMVVEAIGGQGKSALTWEWITRYARQALPDLEGIVWWSFYEGGTSTSTFIRHALAYTTRQDPNTKKLRKLSFYERSQSLLTELQRKPYLLVLDGFERVLAAYHRMNQAHIPDDKVKTSHRDCTNPKDGELLRHFQQCAPSKILISTRLMPKALETRARRPIARVQRTKLEGLSPEDALFMLQDAGIRGDAGAMIRFSEQFGHHGLLLNIVVGMIANYREAPDDFDRWIADPRAGGGLQLHRLNLKQRRTHILEFAYEGLDPTIRQLLSRIAVLGDSADHATLSVLNPYLPPRPAPVPEPRDLADDREDDFALRRLERRRDAAETNEVREDAENNIERHKAQRQAEYEEKKQAYEAFQKAIADYEASEAYEQASTNFEAALMELEERGLLNWDRDANTYDLHPVVRAYAYEQLEERDHTQTYDRVRNHFERRPKDNLDEATELSHLKNSLEIYRAFVGAGHFDEAVRFYRGSFSDTLFFALGAYHTVLGLLTPLFPEGLSGYPAVTSTSAQGYIINDIAIALGQLGREQEALMYFEKALKHDWDNDNWGVLPLRLRNYSASLWVLNRLATSNRSLKLSYEFSETVENEEQSTTTLMDLMVDCSTYGQFEDALSLYEAFRSRPQPGYAIYRSGYSEYWHCKLLFYQDKLTQEALDDAFDMASQGRNVRKQEDLFFLQAEYHLSESQSEKALEAIEHALVLARKHDRPTRSYLAVRALALAELGRKQDARRALKDALRETEKASATHLFAAKAYLALGNRDKASELALLAYEWAWADGPPFCRWYDLQQCRHLLETLGVPEPELPPFDPKNVEPIPYEAEIRAVIEKLKAEKEKREEEDE